MKTQIKIEFVAQQVTVMADLLWGENPNLCQQLWDMLPYSSVQMHTMVSGKNIYHLLPTLAVGFKPDDKPVSRLSSPLGSIFMYYPRLLLLKYGQDFEDRSFPRVAQVIPEDLQHLDQIGKSCWDNINSKNAANVIKISPVNLLGNPHSKFIVPEIIKNRKCRDLITDLHTTITDEWLIPPQEIINFYQHKIDQPMGSYGVKTPTSIFAEGEVRHLVGVAGFGIVDSLLKSCKSNEHIDLKFAEHIFSFTAKGPAFFLGFCGLKKLQEYFSRTMDIFSELDKQEVIGLLEALSLYGNMIHIWHMHYFPWQQVEFKNA